MTLEITIKQSGKKDKVVTTFLGDEAGLPLMKKLWEVEQVLNNLPGANLRVHINITESK